MTGVPFLDIALAGLLSVGGTGFLVDIGLGWFHSAIAIATDDTDG